MPRIFAKGQPECQVFQHGNSSSNEFAKCQKNRGHEDFIPVKEFNIRHLPKELQCFEALETIQRWADLTVKITVTSVSASRPSTHPGTSIPYPYSRMNEEDGIRIRCGTGFITAVSKPVIKQCRCFKCSVSHRDPRMEYKAIVVETAAHVVYDDYEAQNSVLECFYDSEDKKVVARLYGISAKSLTFQDTSTMICTTHDMQVLSKIEKLLQTPLCCDFSVFGWGIIISHPHGCSKKITTGRFHFARRPASVEASKEFAFEDQSYPNMERYFPLDRPLHIRLTHSLNCGSNADIVNRVCPCRRVFGIDYNFHSLPAGTVMCLSTDSDCDFQSYEGHGMGGGWGPLPQGVRFILPSGTAVEFPSDTQINDISFRTQGFIRLFYEINTCPGCSGAPILSFDNSRTLEPDSPHQQIVHSYTYKGGCNRSSYHFASFMGPLPKLPTMYLWNRMNVARKNILKRKGGNLKKVSKAQGRVRRQRRMRERQMKKRMDSSQMLELTLSYFVFLFVFHGISLLWSYMSIFFFNHNSSIYFVSASLTQVYFTFRLLRDANVIDLWAVGWRPCWALIMFSLFWLYLSSYLF